MTRFSLMRSIKRFGGLLLLLGLRERVCVVAQTPVADGQVIKINSAAGKITIKHGPLQQFGMDEGMTIGLSRGRPGDAGGRQTRRQNQIRVRSRERPVRRHKNREGAMRYNSDRGHYVGFAVADMSHGFSTSSRGGCFTMRSSAAALPRSSPFSMFSTAGLSAAACNATDIKSPSASSMPSRLRW